MVGRLKRKYNASSDCARIAVFNHKGGVGKTTLTVNIAAELATMGNRVLLVDADPQCNLSSYLIEEQVLDDLLDKSDTAEGKTIWSCVKPLADATGDVRVVDPIELSIDNLYLLPGDIRLSEFESDLSDFWSQCFARKPKGFRGTSAISYLVAQICESHEFDYVFYDAGPNIGALNKVILLDCTQLVVSVACDLFSIRALKTLGRTLSSWIQEWEMVSDFGPKDTHLLVGRPKILGYIPQRFRIYAGRPASAQTKFLARIDRSIKSDIVNVLNKIDPDLVPSKRQLKLGEVKDFGSIVSASQQEGVPISLVSAGSTTQKEAAEEVFEEIACRIDDLVKG